VQVRALCEKAKEILMEESNVQVCHCDFNIKLAGKSSEVQRVAFFSWLKVSI
jgi:hypothetical protein